MDIDLITMVYDVTNNSISDVTTPIADDLLDIYHVSPPFQPGLHVYNILKHISCCVSIQSNLSIVVGPK